MRKALQQTVSDITRTLGELGNEADRRATAFRTHSRKTIADAMAKSIDAQRELLAEVLAFIALYDDVARGQPATNRTPGSLTSAHIDHKSHQRRVEELRKSLMTEHGFLEAEAAE